MVGLQERFEETAVVDVRRRRQYVQGQAVAVGEQVVLRPSFSAIGGVRPGQLSPLLARTDTTWMLGRDESRTFSSSELLKHPAVQLFPHSGFLPIAQPAPGGVPGSATELCGRVPQPAPGMEHEKDALQGGTVIDPQPPTRNPRRDQRSDQLSQPVIDHPLMLPRDHAGMVDHPDEGNQQPTKL